MGTTTYFGLPYPASSDPVASGASNIQSLAEYTETSLFEVQATAGLRNRLINGSMEFWQRGTTAVTTSGTYFADRWVTFGNATISATRANVTPNAVIPGRIRYGTQFTVTSTGLSGSNAGIIQKIESAGTLAGKTVTVSFYAYASLANLEIACSLYRYFGAGGSPSTAQELLAYTARKTSSLSTSSWNRYTFSFIVPNISGKTLGTSGNDALQVYLWFDAGSAYNTQTDSLGNQSGTFYVTGVQLEQGPGASDFEERPSQTEFALCQRYYETTAITPGSFNGPLVNITSATNGFSEFCTYIKFSVAKRSNSYSMTGYRYDTGTGGAWLINRSGFTGTPAPIFDQLGVNGCRGYAAIGATWAAVDAYPIWSCSNEL